jgi:succinate dehydrogenase / fumarate reductase, membrane anchor subunit
MVNKVIVGAHYGTGAWLGQRVSAGAMAIYTLIFALALLVARPADYAGWHALFAQGWMKFATLIFVLCLCYHAWVGVRDIFMDYVKPVGLRLVLHAAAVLLLVGYAGWAIQILWRT